MVGGEGARMCVARPLLVARTEWTQQRKQASNRSSTYSSTAYHSAAQHSASRILAWLFAVCSRGLHFSSLARVLADADRDTSRVSSFCIQTPLMLFAAAGQVGKLNIPINHMQELRFRALCSMAQPDERPQRARLSGRSMQNGTFLAAALSAASDGCLDRFELAQLGDAGQLTR